MKIETWEVIKDEEIITPKMLRANPKKYGGLGLVMLAAIQNGIVTIPIKYEGVHCALQTNNKDAIKRILSDNGVDIHSDVYWNNIADKRIKICYKGTNEQIKVWDSMEVLDKAFTPLY